MGRSVSKPDLNSGVSTVASTAGFSAGDWVYQMQTTAGTIPAGALPTGAFNYSGVTSSINPSSSTNTGNLNYVELNGGSTGGQVAAKLNNVNIVFVYCRNSNASSYLKTAYFKIVDASGTVVVAETAVSGATVGGKNGVSVCVLPNNNFVVCWTNQQAGGNYFVAYRIYQETGVAVTAAFVGTISQNASTGGYGALLKIKPRSDNSFIMMGYDGANARFLAGNATGFIGGFNYQRTLRTNEGQYVDFAIRSDDTTHIFYSTAQGLLNYDILNTSGTLTTTGTLIVPIVDVFCVSCILMPSGSVNVFYYGIDSTGCFIGGISWNGATATTIGRLVSFTTTTTPTYTFLNSYAQGAGGNFTLFYAHVDTAGTLTYQTFNSSGAVISGSFARTVPSISYPLGSVLQLSVFDVGSETRAYMGARQNNTAAADQTYYTGWVGGIFYFSYNSTSYNLNPLSTVSYNYGVTGSVPLGAVVQSSSTVGEAAFTVSATGSYPARIAAGTNLIQNTTVTPTACIAVAGAQLQNGNFVVSYVTSGGILWLKTYTSTGVEVNAVVAATSVNTSHRTCSVAPFANGSFIVIYGSSASNLLYKIYNASLTELFAGTITTTVQMSGVDTGNSYVAAYGDCTQAVVAYGTSGGRIELKEVTSANVVSAIYTGSVANNVGCIQLIPHRSNSFSVYYRDGAGSSSVDYYAETWYKTAPATFTSGGMWNPSFTDYSVVQLMCGPNTPPPANNMFSILNNSSNSSPFRILNTEPLVNVNLNLFNNFNVNAATYSFDSSTRHAIGYAGNGAAVWATSRSTTIGYFVQYVNIRSLQSSNATNALGVGTVVATALGTNSSYPSICAIPNVDGSCIIIYIDANQYPAFFSPVVQDSYVYKTFTAGTDVSSTKLMLTPENGYALLGVAITAASPGSTGLVQTKGTASLNASYPAGMPYTAFDFRSSLTRGVRGSVTGRTVTLEGQ